MKEAARDTTQLGIYVGLCSYYHVYSEELSNAVGRITYAQRNDYVHTSGVGGMYIDLQSDCVPCVMDDWQLSPTMTNSQPLTNANVIIRSLQTHVFKLMAGVARSPLDLNYIYFGLFVNSRAGYN